MEHPVRFEVVGTVLVARFSGTFSAEHDLPLFRDALAECRRLGMKRVLCDFSEQIGEIGYLGRLRLGEEVAEMWDRDIRLALHGRPEQFHGDRVGAAAAKLRGMSVAVFADRSEALEWLEGSEASNTSREPKIDAEGIRDLTRQQLTERVKELATLHRVSRVLQEDRPIPDLLADIATSLSAGWQFPEITVARVRFDGAEFPGRGFAETPWRQSAEFLLDDGRNGDVSVCYLRESPAESEGVFLAEERELLDTVAELLRVHLNRRAATERAERRLRRIASLRNIDKAILSSLSLQVTQSIVLDETMSELEADAADILLFHPHMLRLEFFAGRGFRVAGMQQFRFRLGEGHAGRAAAERETVSIPRLADAPGHGARSAHLEREGFVSYYAAPLVAKGALKGVLEVYFRSPHRPEADWLEFLETIAGQAAIAVVNLEMLDQVQRSNTELTIAYDATLEGWTKALDLRDKETEGHTERVTELTERLARHMGVEDAEVVHFRRGALLHDIGKLGVPDSILLKPGPLTDDEWKVMRMHPVYAYDWLSPVAYLKPAIHIPHCHHEKWDGTGYPRGLKEEGIPVPARMFAIIDVYDALTSDRPYRKGWTKEATLEHIRAQSGKHFDPRVVEAFLDMMR